MQSRHKAQIATIFEQAVASLLAGSELTAPEITLERPRDPSHGDIQQRPMDRGFIALLFLISVSGLALMLSKNSMAMPSLLALHLGLVMALFLTLPYGKFAHGIFRMASLLRFSVEKRQPSKLALGSD